MYKLLLIEDNIDLANTVCDFFETPLYQITHVADGQVGYKLAKDENFDLIILDIMLPKKNGLVVASQLRRNHIETPILIVSTKNLVDDIVNGFCFGIDSYVTKPFSLRELKSRCLALLRRPTHSTKTKLELADLCLNLQNLKVKRDSKDIILRKKEFCMLKYLLENQNRVVTKEQLIDNIWSWNDGDCTENNLDVHISGLRGKIDKGHAQKLLHTVHGVGYTLCLKQEG